MGPAAGGARPGSIRMLFGSFPVVNKFPVAVPRDVIGYPAAVPETSASAAMLTRSVCPAVSLLLLMYTYATTSMYPFLATAAVPV
ncbi:MAG: hypothetical protein BWY06_02838 [Candidatus Latescibacteria bacterium ADurb.Bin168]|nr:MAG: hypothetical protein BWY06_02838 [Candidatus Latescibacteria bacterium ADurb.Bin168]